MTGGKDPRILFCFLPKLLREKISLARARRATCRTETRAAAVSPDDRMELLEGLPVRPRKLRIAFAKRFASILRGTRAARLSLPTAGLTGHTNTCTRHTVSVTDVMHAISRGLPQCAQTLRPGTCPAPGFASRVRRYARSYLVLARHDSDFTIHPSLSVPSSQPLRRDGAPSRRSFFWIAAVARCSMLTTGGRSGRRVGPHRRGALL